MLILLVIIVGYGSPVPTAIQSSLWFIIFLIIETRTVIPSMVGINCGVFGSP